MAKMKTWGKVALGVALMSAAVFVARRFKALDVEVEVDDDEVADSAEKEAKLQEEINKQNK